LRSSCRQVDTEPVGAEQTGAHALPQDQPQSDRHQDSSGRLVCGGP
jgi:hypothetical protein